LTEEIDCRYKPTSRDPIYLSFHFSVVKDTFYPYPNITANRNLILSHTERDWSGECSLIILPSIHHVDHFGYSLP